MPKRKAYRKPNKRPRKKRRAKRQISNTLICRGPRVLPDRYRCKMKYQFGVGINAIVVDWIFRGNSVYDPLQSAGGTQPYGFDQLSSLYDRYVVHGSSCEATLVNTSSSVPSKLVVIPATTATSFTNIRTPMESPYAKDRSLAPNGSGASMRKIKTYQSTRSIRGLVKGAHLIDDELEALVTANPAKEWYWHIITGSLDTGSTSTGQLEVELVFYVDFFKRKQLTAS